MTITNGYCTAAELATYMGGVTFSTPNSTNAEIAIEAASRAIDDYCNRVFYREDASAPYAATLRRYDAYGDSATVDDFYDTTGLVIALDDDDDGTAETTLTTADYELRPLNGIDPLLGTVPYYRIRLRKQVFTGSPSCLHVTALWGWTAVPLQIKRACLVLSAEMMKDADTPFGVAGFDGFGAVRIRENPRVEQALRPFMRGDRVGIA